MVGLPTVRMLPARAAERLLVRGNLVRRGSTAGTFWRTVIDMPTPIGTVCSDCDEHSVC